MYQISLIILIVMAALVRTQTSTPKDDLVSENKTSKIVSTTIKYNSSSFEEVKIIQTVNEEQKDVFVAEGLQQTNVTTNDINKETSNDFEDQTEETTTEDPTEPDLETAKMEIKAWVENLNCRNSYFGPLNCLMIKRLVKNYLAHGDNIDSAILTARVQKLYEKFKGNIKIGPELKTLINKYKKFLVKKDIPFVVDNKRPESNISKPENKTST